jgi:hypothetical protein
MLGEEEFSVRPRSEDRLDAFIETHGLLEDGVIKAAQLEAQDLPRNPLLNRPDFLATQLVKAECDPIGRLGTIVCTGDASLQSRTFGRWTSGHQR